MGVLDYLGAVKPPTRAIAEEIAEKFDLPDYPAPYNGPVMWGYNAGGAEHGTGRAIDFMTRNTPAVGDEIAEYLWANRERFGLIHMIWKRRIKSTKVDPGNWRYMGDRGSPTENHMDHVHAYFDGRSIGSEPKTKHDSSSGASRYYQPYGTDLSVKDIQKIVGVTQDGFYGTNTKVAVKALQKRLGVTADGLWGPSTQEAYDKGSVKPKPASKPASKPVPKFPLPKGHWYGVESKNPRNHSGFYKKDRPGIKQYQTQMADVRKWRGMGEIDGVFGEKTEAVTKQFQKEKGLKVDGAVGAITWAAAWTEDIT